MDGSPMTFTSLALILLLVIMLVMFACHFIGPRASTWMHSNKEEKIGLSKNKLFHTNSGYMVNGIQTGSEFLLSNSGSFKRFDTLGKDDYKHEAAQHPAQQNTTPLWNIPQTEVNIPPQPLRPAPAIGRQSSIKSVTFSFDRLNEISALRTDEVVNNVKHSSLKKHIYSPIPQPLDAPPAPRLSSSSSVTLSATAIPRPVAKRQISLQNGIAAMHQQHHQYRDVHNSSTTTNGQRFRLTRRNSSTNPFLCESAESLQETDHLNEMDFASNTNTNSVKQTSNNDIVNTMNGGTSSASSPSNATNNNNNPFHDESCSADEYKQEMYALNGGKEHQTTLSAMPNGARQFCGKPLSPLKQNLLKNPKFRNRSFSETEGDSDLRTYSSKLASAGLQKISNTTNPFTGFTQKIQKGPHMLQKTISEDFLFRKLGVSHTNGGGMGNQTKSGVNGGNTTWSFGRCLLRQDSTYSLGRRNSSQTSLNSPNGSIDGIQLEHAISCESVDSQSSLFTNDLDQPYTQITGYLCVGLHYDNNSINEDGMELKVSLLEAKDLLCPFSVDSLDTFVRIYLVPDQAGAMQTKVVTNSQTPYYNESFIFWLKKQQGRHSLWFHLYHNGVAHTLIGEAEMEIGEVPRPIITWIPLTDSRKCNAKWGELMFSLSYLPTAERLTIVVVKGRNLKLDTQNEEATNAEQQIQSVFVKVYLMNNEHNKLLKKRTSLKRTDRFPIFNESMIFSVPPQSLTTVQLRLTVFGTFDENATVKIIPLGHVITGSCATGKGLRHWHQMLSSLRKPVAMWHVLRRASNQPIFTGGAEAVVAAMESTALRAKRNSII